MSDEDAKAAKSRMASLVCAGAAILWVLAQWLGPVLGLPGQFAILIDLAVLAASTNSWSRYILKSAALARDECRGAE